MTNFDPEGILMNTQENINTLKTQSGIMEAHSLQKIVEARAVVCDSEHNLLVDLGCMKGIMPREECAIGIAEGKTKDIAIITKVNKPISFFITQIKKDKNNQNYAMLSRRSLQEKCKEEYIDKLSSGDIIKARITHLESFGCFVDVGCGIISLVPIDSISVSRISHPKDRFKIGQEILVVVKGFDEDNKLCLSHKELLGTWEENVSKFEVGQTVAGIVRSIESYGIFVELSPNLAGLAEYREDVKIGQQTSVYIKNIIPEKMKIKLIIVDSFDANYENAKFDYFINSEHMDYWRYSPEKSDKTIETTFM